ncbi:MAG: hypothetical protein VYA80_06880 [Pseudomonadota bacterium]|nr:hypothetical protein [Pseudomonadota bacterium]
MQKSELTTKNRLKSAFIVLVLTSALTCWSSVTFSANQPKSWFIDQIGNEHPGYRFRFKNTVNLKRVIQAQEKQFNKLMRKPGVVGTAIGWDKTGEPIIRVFSNGVSATDVPTSIDGFAVTVESIGSVYALKYACKKKNKGSSKKCLDENTTSISTTDRLRPVPNGVSIGHPNITAGTLGCIVTQGCHILALSNNHVLADSNDAFVGDLIIQPGVFDGGTYPTDNVGTLFSSVEIIMSETAFNRVDGALALVNGSDFSNTALPDGYGMPKSSWMEPQAGMSVMKYGRTTRFTQGIITGINASVNVNYKICCARFVGQVVVQADSGFSDFALAGDSGSLLVVNGGSDDRRPVGLIFALADDGSVFANPISDVISELGIDNILGY